MSTIETIVSVLEKAGRPLTSAEIAKAGKLSGGAVSGAIWRLEKHKTVSASPPADGKLGRQFTLTGKKPPASRSGPTHPVTRRRKKNSRTSAGVQFRVVLSLNGSNHLISLAQANEIYRQLSELLKPLESK